MKKFSLKNTFLRTIKGILPVCFLLLSANMYAVEFAGQTTAGTYEVSSAATLQLIQAFVNGTTPYASKSQCTNYIFNQTADIDLTGITWLPIGNVGYRFKGSYDGKNFKITGLSINLPAAATDGVGLFGYLDTGGSLKNITIEGGTVNGKNAVGALTGGVNSNIVDNCKSSCLVNGLGGVGGLIGKTEGNVTVSNCSATGNVEAQSNQSNAMGGLIGSANAGTTAKISNCFATGNVTGKFQVGGFIGGFNGSSGGYVENCYATGNVTIVLENKAGGFIGEISGFITVRNCYATGSVTNTGTQGNYLGGFAGDIRETSFVYNCYAKGDVLSGNQNIGGFAGHTNQSTVQNCYATGAVTGISNVGGLVGFTEAGTTTKFVNCVALNPSINRRSGTDLNFGAAIGKNTVATLANYTPNYSFDNMVLPSGTIIGLAGTTQSKTQIRTATNWWDALLSTPAGYYSTITIATPTTVAGTFVPTDVWTFANDQLPVLKNAFFVNQTGTLPSHLDGTTQALQSLEINNKMFSVANNKLNILEDGVRSIQIYNLSGRLILDKTIKSNSIDISTLSAGIYIINANTIDGLRAAKIIK